MHELRKPFLAVVAAMAIAVATAGSSADVLLLPQSSILWRTAPSGEFELPVILPDGATSATLAVTGSGYRRTYAGLKDGMFVLSLPAASSADCEDVYDLVLTFDDAKATEFRAKLAVVAGMSQGDSASADVRKAASRKWPHVVSKAVLPIPAGTGSLSAGGKETVFAPADTPGWFLLGLQPGIVCDVSLSDDGENVFAAATLCGVSSGFKLLLR